MLWGTSPPRPFVRRSRGLLDHVGSTMRMKAYASFDAYLRDQPSRNRTIIRALRKFVRSVEPGLVEAVKWSNGCWLVGREPVAFVYSDDGFVQFGFTMGTRLR